MRNNTNVPRSCFFHDQIEHSCNTTFYLQPDSINNIDDGSLFNDDVIYILSIFLNCILISIIGSFGVIGNCINIAVLRQHGLKESTNIVLMSLSFSDLAFSIMLPLTKLSCVVQNFDEGLAITLTTFGRVILFMPKFVAAANSFTHIGIIAVERFVAVFFPFKVSKVFTPKVMKILVFMSYAISFGTLSPTFFSYDYEWRYDASVNKTVAMVKPTHYYEANKAFLDIYMWVVLNNYFCTLSMVIVLACCLAIGFKLTRAAVKREKMTTRAAGYDVKVVKMLVVVCVVYLCVQIPSITIYIYNNADFIHMSPEQRLANDACEVFYGINASANFLVYVSMSEKFANTYKRLLGFGRYKQSRK